MKELERFMEITIPMTRTTTIRKRSAMKTSATRAIMFIRFSRNEVIPVNRSEMYALEVTTITRSDHSPVSLSYPSEGARAAPGMEKPLPPSASSIRPLRAWMSPVNAPFS